MLDCDIIKYVKKYFVLYMSLFAMFVLLMMLNFTAPLDIGPFGVLVFFTMIYVLVFGIFFGLGRVCLLVSGAKGNVSTKFVIYVAVIAFGPIMLLLMRSFEMLNIISASAVVVFVMLACFLIKKR